MKRIKVKSREFAYDKKLLWRANLYIDEGGGDWNEAHKWNAPASAAEAANAPAWWKAEYGYNEWNRRMKLTPEFLNGKTVGLANLPAGDGGQGVEFPSFTPLRTLPSGQNPVSTNRLSGTVAYSYPQHDFEKNGGLSGSMDSPFDFLWKMNRQKALMAAGYDKDGNVKTAQSATSWTSTEAPTHAAHSWKKYLPGSSEQSGYIPSLGLWYLDPDHGTVEDNAETLDWKKNYIFEAGTDCVGFAERVMSWRFEPGKKNAYVWKDLPPGIMEYSDGAGTENYTTVCDQFVGRYYPVPGGQEGAADTVVKKEDSRTTEAEKKEFLEKLRRIIPGDIWVKDRTNQVGVDMDNLWKEHIAVVASVPADPDSINDIDTYLSQIVLIEAEYSNKIQSVVKFITVKSYDQNEIKETDHNGVLYPGVPIPPGGIGLNCQSWAIQRLK